MFARFQDLPIIAKIAVPATIVALVAIGIVVQASMALSNLSATAASLVGQWLLGRKYVENWPLWIVVDVVGAALFAYKGLWLTTILYLVFVAMAALGWRSWQAKAAARGSAR